MPITSPVDTTLQKHPCACGLSCPSEEHPMWDTTVLPLSKISYHWKNCSTKLNFKGIIIDLYEDLQLNHVKKCGD